MEQMSSCLSTYIEQVLYGHDYPRSRNKIFDRGIYQFSPILEHGRINRILFYPGCFNPPHLGHLELLRHGFMESGRDLNIVAAIVLPLDDESLRGKFSKQGGTLILPKDERVRLWGDCSLNDWYWVFDRSETEWLIFQKRLSQVVTKAGFDIRWVWLCGPDHIKVDRTPIQAWGCKEYIVSDVGRSASFTSNTIDRLTSLKGYGAWEEIAPDVEILKKDATDCARWRCSGFMIDPRVARRNLNEDPDWFNRMVDQNFEECTKKINATRLCRRRDNPEITIRFIPAKSSIMEMSSTRVRAVMKNTPSGDLLKKLKPLVLFPEVLIGLLSKSYDITLQPEIRPFSQEQLAAEVKHIYAHLSMTERACIEADDRQATLAQTDPKRSPINNKLWQALIELHRALLHDYHDFFLASQHPSASPALRRLASKYAVPFRMWHHGIYTFLELLRHRLPSSLDHMLTFIYLAYSMVGLLYEIVPEFEATWTECLGHLSYYRMGIENKDILDRELWAGVARHWYLKADYLQALPTRRSSHHRTRQSVHPTLPDSTKSHISLVEEWAGQPPPVMLSLRERTQVSFLTTSAEVGTGLKSTRGKEQKQGAETGSKGWRWRGIMLNRTRKQDNDD